MTIPSDQPARDAIVERLDENMVVEAGAGTGKTTSLVERVVALVTTGRASMGGIAAITFTEAAAAELRSRIGEKLERVDSDFYRDLTEVERSWRAVDDLDQAAIQTLHSFAASLLRERPLEAGLPPGFNVRDPIEAEVAFERKWSEWLDATLDDPEAQEALRPALEEGMTLRHIREIAVSFNTNYDLLADASFDSPLEQSGEGEREAALLPVLELLRRFALDYADERKAAGEVEFQDLLVLARDLLRNSIPARDHFRGRYSHVLIDEVQDTDPLQAEIAMFLAEDVSGNVESAPRPDDWHRVRPARGKIFIVGDAKQSIYRFRRADIRQVELMQKLVGGSNEKLTQNFRSQSPVINWVNHVFRRWMVESDGQPEYIPLDAEPSEDESPPVRYFGEAIGGNIGVVRREEADAIAHTIQTAIEEGWRVRSEDVDSETRPVKYQDVCVLMPSRTGLEKALEYAFETAGIPYRLDSAGLIYESQEARDLLNCLSAIDDPTDQISVVAALRSPALACSDADLLEFVEAGGQFDYLADDDPPAGYTSDALAVLREFHERRRWSSPAALIEEFVRERRLMELALDARQWRSRWMRYRFLIDRARAFASSGEASLRVYLTWTARQREEQARARETAVPESDEDAVRVMTIHGAKGLEFPFLILAGLNSPPTHRPDAVLFDRESGKVEVKVGSGDSSFQTAGYAEFAELDKVREEEEDVRLMYVAATRARDHLIVSLYRNSRGKNSAAARIEGYMEGADHLWERFDPPAPEDGSLAALPIETATPEDDTPEARQHWKEERDTAYAAQSRPFSVAATRLAQEKKNEQDVADEPWRRGRAGTSIGRAVHAVLQVVDLETGNSLQDIAKAQAAAEGVPGRADEIARLVRRALDSPLVKRALDSKRWWREAPVAGPVGDGIVEGFIDLLFEEEGGFVIVDYKTDALGSDDEIEQAMARYRLQGGGYALALNKATDATVKEVSFLFLEPNREVPVDDLSGAMREAEGAALALFSGSTSQ